MDMDELENISAGSASYYPNNRKDRVIAKLKLWEYINDIGQWDGPMDELFEGISHEAMRILHPHFNSSEILQELQNIYTTLKMNEPGGLNRFTTQYFDMLLSKVKRFFR